MSLAKAGNDTLRARAGLVILGWESAHFRAVRGPFVKRTEPQTGIRAKRRRRHRRLAAAGILLASCLLSPPGGAQEAEPPLPGPEPPREDQPVPRREPPRENQPAPTPPAETSEPGDDVVLDEGFTPSERIPAGSSVSFPVDI